MTNPTPAMIRRRPFAAPGHMITDHDEAFIAAHMRASVTAERRARHMTSDDGARPGNYKYAPPPPKDFARRNAVVEMLKSGPMLVRDISASMGGDVSRDATYAFLRKMAREGLITYRRRAGSNCQEREWLLPEVAQ